MSIISTARSVLPIVITTDGEIYKILPPNRQAFSEEELQEYVEGYFEFITLDDGRIAVVNESAKIDGAAINMTASDCYGILLYGNILVCDKSYLVKESK